MDSELQITEHTDLVDFLAQYPLRRELNGYLSAIREHSEHERLNDLRQIVDLDSEIP